VLRSGGAAHAKSGPAYAEALRDSNGFTQRFSTGRNPNHASVAMTEGILNLLDDEELEGVLAHELGHVRNRDILTSSIAATLAGAITVLARMGMFFGFGGDRDRDRGGGI